MQGLVFTADFYDRITTAGKTTWSTGPALIDWECWYEPLDADLQLREDLALSTHFAIGPAPAIEIKRGMKVIVRRKGAAGGTTYYVQGVQEFDVPFKQPFSLELYLSRGEP